MTTANIQHNAALEFMEALPWDRFQTVLDMGGGDGFAAAEFQRRGKTATVVDRVVPTLCAEYLTADVTSVPLSSGLVDAVWSHHCLEHVAAPLHALLEWARLVRHDGWLFLTIPDCTETVSTDHIHSFTWPMLAYNLAIAGFDMRNGWCQQRRSHMRVITQAKYMRGENSLTKLAPRLPAACADQIAKTGRMGQWRPTV